MTKIDERIAKIKEKADLGREVAPEDALFLIDYIEHLKGRKASER